MSVKKPITNSIEKTRILSDNYNCFLIAHLRSGDIEIDLSEYSLKSVRWDSRDEAEIWKPVTSKVEHVRVIKKGFDFDLSWAKNSADLMNLLLDQYINYHVAETHANKGIMKDVYDQKRTEKNAIKGTKSTVDHRWQKSDNDINTLQVGYVVPTFTLKIIIYDPLIQLSIREQAKEVYYFHDFVMFKPSQATSQNSSEIEESLKGFSSKVMTDKEKTLFLNENVKNLSWDMLYEQFLLNINANNLATNDRMVLNPDNTDLYK